MKLPFAVPDDFDFSTLKLSRDPVTGSIEFDWAPVEAICRASGVDPKIFREQPEDNVAGLIVAWYAQHRQNGGALDPVAEQLIAEVEAEDEFGEGRVQRGPVKPQ